MKNKKGFSISRVFPAIAHNTKIDECLKQQRYEQYITLKKEFEEKSK